MSENNGLVVALGQKDVDELSWVADVLTEIADKGGDRPWSHVEYELNDLAALIASKLPKTERALLSEYTVFDKNGAEYKNFDGTWYLVADGHALEVPYESIQEPRPLRLAVVE